VSDYEFTTVWRFDSPIESVWAKIKAIENWSDWWKGVLNVEELTPGNDKGVGAVYRTTWKSALPYKLRFDSEVARVDYLKSIEARAFGELEGFGKWTFTRESENVTRLQYDWRVITTKRWMKLLAPIAKPFFRWNHDVIMNWGGEGLAKKLNCKLL
jgi:hypothetical protein